MQVPERLALIGGSILLASTLIFTLKSQASSIIPNVSHSISNVYGHIGDAQYDSEFGNGYKEAQKNGWTTGTWGSAKYYIDTNDTMHVDKGDLQGTLTSVIGNDVANHLKGIDFTQSVHVPDNSSALLANVPQVEHINGLNNWEISNVKDLTWVFAGDSSLTNLNLSHWNIPMVTYLGDMFNGTSNLRSLDISNFQTAYIMGGMFNNTGLTQVTVGKDTNLWGGQGLQGRGKWKAPNGFVGDFPGGGDNAGTWTLQ